MNPPEVYYYVTGGTLRPDAPSYVERHADTELREHLLRGEFCYVLTSRQMGKSSLMVRTVRQLREQGVAVAVLDLTAIGQNLTVEQWYEGLTERLGQQLGLDDELEDFWLANPRLSPVQRFFNAIRQVALKHRPGRLVIFVDEIDSVRSLPFSTDEFFAAIREGYNRRAVDHEFDRLTFCLLGVATPSDLIRDTRTTPFNIGQRIELTDFTVDEARALEPGLREGRAPEQVREILCRILYWTHGHPYLTQRLCKAVAEHPEVISRRGVDTLCTDLFLSDRARERDDNLIFVRERILRSETDRVSLLDLYLRIWQGRRIADDPANPLAAILRLAGIVRCEQGRLMVRMPIYERVFDRKWALGNMPDAELRRQREAFHSGILRTAGVALLLVLVIGGLARYGFEQAEQARISAEAETFERQRAEEARSQMAGMLEQMEVHQAEELFQDDHSSTALAYLAHALRNNPSNRVAVARLVSALSQRTYALPLPDAGRLEPAERPRPPAGRLLNIRGESVFILNENREPVTEQPLRHDGPVRDAQFSPDGQRVVTAAADNTARIWDANTGLPVSPPMKHGGAVWLAKFSPEGQRVLTLSLLERAARIWDAATGEPLTEPFQVPPFLREIDFSGDGQAVVWSTRGQPMQRQRSARDIRPGKMLSLSLRTEQTVTSVRFNHDGSRVVVAGRDGGVRVWDTLTGRPAGPVMNHVRAVGMAVFSPDGKMVATACDDRMARIWSVETGLEVPPKPLAHGREVRSVVFSADGARLATASGDETARVWDAHTGQLLMPPFRHPSEVRNVVFSPDGSLLLTVAGDGAARLWNLRANEPVGEEMRHDDLIFTATFNHDGTRIVTASRDGSARLWDAAGGKPLTEPLNHNGYVHAARFSPDGTRVVTASADRTARLWDAATGQPVGTPFMHESQVVHAQFFPGGTRVLTAAADKSAAVWDISGSQPLTERFLPPGGGRAGPPIFFEAVLTTDLHPAGEWIASAGGDGTVQLWHPLSPPLSAPDWLASLAEAISGERVNQRGLLETADTGAFIRVREVLRHSRSDDFYTHWAKWFFADRALRTISPASPVTVAEYLERRLEENRLASLQEAVRLAPTNALALSRLARAMLDDTTLAGSRTQAEAVFLTETALKLAPREAEIWQRRAEVLALAGDVTRADDAVERGLKLHPGYSGLWNARGLVLEKKLQLSAADAAYTKAIELAEAAGETARRAAYFQNRTFLRQRLSTEPPGGATRD